LEETYNQIKRRTLPPTFERAGSAWLDADKPQLAERSYEIYEVAYRCHLKPVLGSLLLCDIDASKIASYQAKRERASARTLKRLVGLGGLEPPTSPLSVLRPSQYVRRHSWKLALPEG
jgi:hypothetical protein